MKTKIKVDSVENQEIKSRFVRREVLTCFSYEMEAILVASSTINVRELDLPSYEDIENAYQDTCPKCGSTDIYYTPKGTPNDDCFECGSCGVIQENTELTQDTPQEIYEWWIVTDFLCDKLRKQGEPVLKWGNNCYWGRTTTGQAILLDSVISQICLDMEILDGQKYSWKQ